MIMQVRPLQPQLVPRGEHDQPALHGGGGRAGQQAIRGEDDDYDF